MVELFIVVVPGLYSTFDSLNFGLLSSLESPKVLPVYVRNTHVSRAITINKVLLDTSAEADERKSAASNSETSEADEVNAEEQPLITVQLLPAKARAGSSGNGAEAESTGAPVRVPAASECTLVALVTCSPQRARRSTLLTGRVLIRSQRDEHTLQVPFGAHVLKGYVTSLPTRSAFTFTCESVSWKLRGSSRYSV